MKWLWILWCSCIAAMAETAAPQMPIPNNYADSIKTRWLGKPILDSRYYGGRILTPAPFFSLSLGLRAAGYDGRAAPIDREQAARPYRLE